MAQLGAGRAIHEIRGRILQLRKELDLLGPPDELPEMIASANLLRQNEYLSKSGEKKAELLEAYEQYSAALEGMLESLLEIQGDLAGILKEQAGMIRGG